MSNDLMNISAFKGIQPANAFKVLDPHAESLADGIGSSYGIVGYKGKVWSLRLRGESYMFVRPDDGSPAAFLDVIVLRAPAYKSKSYYPAGTFQDGQLGARPTCAALNGETPDMDIMEPQNNACATCPRNVLRLQAACRAHSADHDESASRGAADGAGIPSRPCRFAERSRSPRRGHVGPGVPLLVLRDPHRVQSGEAAPPNDIPGPAAAHG